jgi:transposase
MGIYSKDLRIRAVAAVVRGLPRREILETFSISLTTLKRWLRMMSSEGKEDLSPGGLHGAQATHPRDARREEGFFVEPAPRERRRRRHHHHCGASL